MKASLQDWRNKSSVDVLAGQLLRVTQAMSEVTVGIGAQGVWLVC